MVESGAFFGTKRCSSPLGDRRRFITTSFPGTSCPTHFLALPTKSIRKYPVVTGKRERSLGILGSLRKREVRSVEIRGQKLKSVGLDFVRLDFGDRGVRGLLLAARIYDQFARGRSNGRRLQRSLLDGNLELLEFSDYGFMASHCHFRAASQVQPTIGG